MSNKIAQLTSLIKLGQPKKETLAHYEAFLSERSPLKVNEISLPKFILEYFSQIISFSEKLIKTSRILFLTFISLPNSTKDAIVIRRDNL